MVGELVVAFVEELFLLNDLFDYCCFVFCFVCCFICCFFCMYCFCCCLYVFEIGVLVCKLFEAIGGSLFGELVGEFFFLLLYFVLVRWLMRWLLSVCVFFCWIHCCCWFVVDLFVLNNLFHYCCSFVW